MVIHDCTGPLGGFVIGVGKKYSAHPLLGQPKEKKVKLTFGFTTEGEGQPPPKQSEQTRRAAGGIN